MTDFRSIMFDLKRAFNEGTTEMMYHDLVDRIRRYDTNRICPDDEKRILREIEYPETYHPCDHVERLRLCMTFRSE